MRRRGLTGSFWPSRTQEALMRIAFDPEVDPEGAWRALQPLDIENLEPGTFVLLPLVYRRLADAGVGEGRLPRLAGIYRRNWVKNNLHLDRLASLVGAIESAGVEAILCGGAPIATRYYEQLGLRQILQLEAVVPRSEAGRARDALAKRGWSVASTGRDVTRFDDGVGSTAAFVHHGMPAYARGPVAADDAFAALLSSSEARAVGAVQVRALAPSDELFLAVALGARRTVPPVVQWLVDAHVILAAESVDADALVSRVHRHRLGPPFRDTFTYLARFPAVEEAATAIVATLDREGADRPRDVLAYRLAGYGGDRVGGASPTLVSHIRSTLDEPLASAVTKLPESLRESWELKRTRDVPVAAVRKALRRASRATRRQAPAGAPSRSASS
jgi:hypothetical protein